MPAALFSKAPRRSAAVCRRAAPLSLRWSALRGPPHTALFTLFYFCRVCVRLFWSEMLCSSATATGSECHIHLIPSSHDTLRELWVQLPARLVT